MTMPEAQIKLARFALCVNKTFPLFFVNPSPMRQTDENTRCLPTSVKNKWGILNPIPSPLPLHKRRCTKEHWLRTPVRWQLQSACQVPASFLPRGGVTRKRRCNYRTSVIYLIVNKLLPLSLPLSLSSSLFLSVYEETCVESLKRSRGPCSMNQSQSILHTSPHTPNSHAECKAMAE